MNQMNKVWEMLGVECFEEFNVVNPYSYQPYIGSKIRNPYRFDDEGLKNNFMILSDDILVALITGRLRIENLNK